MLPLPFVFAPDPSVYIHCGITYSRTPRTSLSLLRRVYISIECLLMTSDKTWLFFLCLTRIIWASSQMIFGNGEVLMID